MIFFLLGRFASIRVIGIPPRRRSGLCQVGDCQFFRTIAKYSFRAFAASSFLLYINTTSNLVPLWENTAAYWSPFHPLEGQDITLTCTTLFPLRTAVDRTGVRLGLDNKQFVQCSGGSFPPVMPISFMLANVLRFLFPGWPILLYHVLHEAVASIVCPLDALGGKYHAPSVCMYEPYLCSIFRYMGVRLTKGYLGPFSYSTPDAK